MMYYAIASRVGGTGDDLARVRRVFDWIVRADPARSPPAASARDNFRR